MITCENVTAEEQYIFDLFLSALEISPDDIDNYGMASYQNDVFKGHCPAFFGVRDGQMGLLIGVQNGKFGTSDLFIPCEVEQMEVQHGRKMLKEWVYTLNGSPIKLNEQVDNEGKPTGKFYVSLEHRDEYEEYIFTFPFLIDKSRNYTNVEINKAFKTGEFQTIVREFGTSGGRIWLSANKAFIPSFKDNCFPKAGVLLLARNGAIKITPAGSHVNIKSDIAQSDWEIVSTSHPELLVQYFDKEKNQQFITLGEATNLQFTSASVNNEGYTWLVNKGLDSYNDLVLIHIVEPSKIKIENTPVNTVTNVLPRVRMKIQQYPHMLAALENVDDNVFEAGVMSGVVNKVIVPTKARPTRQVTEEEAANDLFPNYPVSPSTLGQKKEKPNGVVEPDNDVLINF